jgi:UDP-GlcNAc:undecaprenyl-phosphate GlcNAc-1-phosphate transferase
MSAESAIDCLLAWIIPFSISTLLTNLLIRWSPRLGLVDLPSARKVHSQPTPRGGGLAIFAAVLVGSLCLGSALERNDWIFLALGAVIALLGLIDDLRSLSWQLRLSVQALVAIIAVSILPLQIPWIGSPFAVLWIVAAINAFNMLDNMDGLSAGVAYVAAAASALVESFHTNGNPFFFLVLMGALLGFLWFNLSPARIFMGDAGSTFLGFILGVRILEMPLLDSGRPETWLVPIFVLAVPLYDLTTVVMLRLAQGRSPFHADKQHLSHRLVQIGLTKPASVRAIHLLAIGSGIGALLLRTVQPLQSLLVLGHAAPVWLALAAIEFGPCLSRAFKGELIE